MSASAGAEPDPYLVLGVVRTATAAEIRAAYRELGAKYHPDRHQGNPLEELASAKMKEINRAYEILSDPARRAAFDRSASRRGFGATGRAAEDAGAGGGFGAGGPGMAAGARTSRRVIQIVALLSLLPIIVRFGGLMARGVAALLRELVEGAALVQGTPFAAGAVLLAAVFLVVALLRRRRARRSRPR